jgi:putative addiction module component (TIGR02574 family)
MDNQTAQILEGALHLPESDRAFIAEKLIESLDADDAPPVSDEWREEIRRRAAAIDRGEVKLIDGEKVFKEAFEALE